MGKTYEVVFNSTISEVTPNLTQNDNQFFFYDWSRIPEGRYKCSFTYVNHVQQRQQFFYTGMLFMDLGQTNVFFAERSALRTTSGRYGQEYYNSTFIGCLENMNTRGAVNPTNGAYIARLDTNPPFYLDKRPTNNRVNIRLIEGTSSTISGNLFDYNLGDFTLTLYLEHLD